MVGSNRILLIFLMVVFISFAYATVGEANAAEPPSILIIVPNAPGDLRISINEVEASRRDKLFEKYYLFYDRDLFSDGKYILQVSTAGSIFEVSLERPLYTYENVFTLDLNDRVLTPGKLQSRSTALIFLRVLITLMVEGFVFYLFGFRQIRSWVTFLIINLITQGLLNLWIGGLFPLAGDGYLFIALFFIEILVIIAEIMAFLLLVKEQSRLRVIVYVVAANILSLLMGMVLITFLPI